MMVRVLSSARHEVIDSADGVDGLRKFRIEEPAVVVTDIMMPHRDGLETIREIRDAGTKTGIIAISGTGVGAGALYLSISKEYGVDAILQKPFRAAELAAAVDEVLDRRRADAAS
jgi:DNA-binding response OmpR family regulator